MAAAELLVWHKNHWMHAINRPTSEIRAYVCDRFAAQALETDPRLAAWKQQQVCDGVQFFAPGCLQESSSSNWCQWYDENPEAATPFIWEIFLGWNNMSHWFDSLSDDVKESFQQWISGCWDRHDCVFLTANREFCTEVMIKEVPREDIYFYVDGLAMNFGVDCRYVGTDQDAPIALQLEWSV